MKIFYESVTKDLMYLYNYLKSDDKSDVTFDVPWYIKDYFDKYGIFIDNDEFNEYMEESEWSDAVDWLYRNDRYKFDQLTKWIVDYKGDEGQRGYTKLYFDDNPELVKNKWLLHFTDHAYNIYREGFDFGTYDMNKLGLTSCRKSKKGGTFAFAYDADKSSVRDYGGRHGRGFKYGSQAIMFRGSGVKVYHNSDEEYQVIFDTRTIKDIVVIELNSDNYTEGWVVTNRKGRPIYKTQSDDRDDFQKCVDWVIKNYENVYKAIATGKAPSMKEPKKHKKQFESFLGKLENDDNKFLIEAVKQGYDVLFESIIAYHGTGANISKFDISNAMSG
jgi:CRISPR/Cas system CSM-associated protein Csm2 small subunit